MATFSVHVIAHGNLGPEAIYRPFCRTLKNNDKVLNVCAHICVDLDHSGKQKFLHIFGKYVYAGCGCCDGLNASLELQSIYHSHRILTLFYAQYDGVCSNP